jgi:hypothetical protein
MNLLIAQQGQPMLPPGFAREHAAFAPLDPTPFILFFPLSIGESLGPAQERTTGVACAATAGSRLPTSTGFEDGRLLALVGSGADRRQMARTETVPGVFDQGTGLVVGALAHDQTPHPCTVNGNQT